MAMLQRQQSSAVSYPSGWYWASDRFQAKPVTVAADRYKILSPAIMQIDVGGVTLTNLTQQTLDLSLDATWDHGQSIGTWTADTPYSVGDLVRPTAAWLADGANNASVAYATSAMLSNTIPGPGVASASNEGGAAAYKSFTRNTAEAWATAGYVGYPQWIKIDFGSGNAKVINKFRNWLFSGANNNPTGITLTASNDNTNWTPVYTTTTLNNLGGASWNTYVVFSNSTPYRYYKLSLDTMNSSYPSLGQLHLVSTPSLVYRCTSAGTSGGTSPAFPAIEGSTVVDSGATWTAYLDNTVASNRAGLDYYIYACVPTSGTVPKLLASKNATVPLGYTANNSRKIAGFHCECEYIGANCYGTTAHGLYGYVKGDILPASVWDLRWKSNSLIGNVGQVYDSSKRAWTGIYPPSVSGGVYNILCGGTVATTINWMDAVDAAATLGMRLSRDGEFQSIAAGSNEKTVIFGATNPTTVAGLVDSAGTRMVSNIGCEMCCGCQWAWLDEQSYQFKDAASHTHAWTVDGTAQSNVVSASGGTAIEPVWGWKDVGGNKGSLYGQGATTFGDAKLCAGGDYQGANVSGTSAAATQCGSRARDGSAYRWLTGANITFRCMARHIEREFI